MTLNIIGLSAFGFDFDSLSDEDSIGKEATKRFTNIIAGGRSQILSSILFLFPVAMNVPLGFFKSVREDIDYTDELVKALAREKRAQLAKNPISSSENHTNILDMLLCSQDIKSISDQQLAEHVKTLLFAGHETTATLTTWCVFALSQQPEIVKRLKEELDEQITDIHSLNYELLEKLTYLKAVIKETLRVYPPVALVARRFERDFHFKEYVVPAGVSCFFPFFLKRNFNFFPPKTTCTISPYVLHHNPKLWDDPEVFNPDRWLSDKKYHPAQFIPFLVCYFTHVDFITEMYLFFL